MPSWSGFEEILENSWAMLAAGVDSATDPFHTPVLGTVSPYGCSLRTVVLRRVIRPERLVICHSDIRAGKIQDIVTDARISWLFYHPDQKIQLRLAGPATLHTDDELAAEQWTTTHLMSRRLYCAVDGPGTPSDEPTSGLPEFRETQSPARAGSEAGRKNFAVIAGRVDFMDWLQLRIQGHRRAQFEWQADQMTACWVVP